MAAPKGERERLEIPLVAPAGAILPASIKVNKHGCAPRRFPKGDRKALWSPPQRRNPGVSGKAIYNGKEQLLGRAHLARQYASCGQSSLGARLRTRKVTGRDASLPAPLLAASLELVARATVGALPQTPQGAPPLDPARGNPPLTPLRD